MSTHKHLDAICGIILVCTLILTASFMSAESLGVQKAETVMGYENRLFDTSTVHTIDIVMDDWEGFLETCTSEEYTSCTVVIDGKAYKNVAIRAKGNTSLTQVKSYGNDRYSFKIEFDHYDSSKTYYGLDKLCLNNIIQDNTYLKDYLTYQLMGQFGVAAPLCSFVNITVNGETWGLYLAVEGIEEAFVQRNYGVDYGKLYKPDNMSMGGGRGNGREFNMEDWKGFGESTDDTTEDIRQTREGGRFAGDRDQEGITPGGSMGSDDVSLIYSGDSYDNYSNIFDNAKTKISDTDKERLIEAIKKINENTDLENAVDIEAVIRYFVVHNFVLNFDSYTGSMIHNYYLYEKDGMLSMIPWDYNLAFGGFQSAGGASNLVNYPIDSPVSGGTIDSRPMLAWIFNNEQYTEQYHALFDEFIADFFESGLFSNMIDSLKEMLAPYVENDPTKFCSYDEFITGIDTLKEFCLLRAESIRGQLNGEIGSTSETQIQSTLISADGITISAMGSMNQSMGGGGMGNMQRPDGDMQFPQDGDMQMPEGGMQFPQGGGMQFPPDGDGQKPEGGMQFPQDGDMQLPEDDASEDSIVPDDSASTQPSEQDNFNNGKMPGNIERPDDNNRGDFEMTQSSGASGQTSILQNSGFLFGISVVVLIIGLAFAMVFKGRR